MKAAHEPAALLWARGDVSCEKRTEEGLVKRRALPAKKESWLLDCLA